MAMIINTNVSALNAQRNLSATNEKMSKTLEKLSSGLRINRAADDAAGLAISSCGRQPTFPPTSDKRSSLAWRPRR